MAQSTDRLRHPRLSLIEEHLGQDLAEYIGARRPQISWRLIAVEVARESGVDITGERLRMWWLERAA